MRFIIYGAGGVGAVIGAELHKAGEEVVLIARGAHLEAMQNHGLHYQTPHEDRRIDIPARGHPAEIEFRDGDVVLMTMKSQHSTTALDALRLAAPEGIPVVCCQNGVANERMALRRFDHVYAMLVYLPGQLIEPGRIQCHAKLKPGVLDLGRFPGGTDTLCDEIAERLELASFSCRPNPTIMRFKYAKLLLNLVNALGAISPSGPGRDAILDQMKDEAEACFRAAGIDWASREEVTDRRRGVFEIGEIPGVERVGSSSRQSLMRKTGDIEVDYLSGEIAYLGRLHGVPTPANTVVQRLANRLASERGELESVSIDRLESLIDAAR
jgi:2-dehydropantoate 2-reductase